MSTTIEELERRLAAVEDEVQNLRRRVQRPDVTGRPPRDETIVEWYAELRRQKAEGPTLAERRRALGIPDDVQFIGAKKLQEMLLAEGVRPEECLVSSEIVRLRNETRP